MFSEGWKKMDSGQEKTLESLNFLVDTAKIRPLKLLSNTSENGGSYKV